MNKHILADYYEEKGFVTKSKRLRKRKFLVPFGWYIQYNEYLHIDLTYGYHQGNGNWFNYGKGKGYHRGNGWDYRWKF